MKTKLYSLIKTLLTDYPELRDSDRKLKWKVWKDLGFAQVYGTNDMFKTGWMITEDNYMEAPNDESIRRCRQKIQETHEELRGTPKVRKLRKEKEKNWGSIIKEQISLI